MALTATAAYERLNLRQNRADLLAAKVMKEIEIFIAEGCLGDAFAEIRRVLADAGAEIITDDERERAGLPPRGPEGYTDEELRIIERFRIELMMRPLNKLMEGEELP